MSRPATREEVERMAEDYGFDVGVARFEALVIDIKGQIDESTRETLSIIARAIADAEYRKAKPLVEEPSLTHYARAFNRGLLLGLGQVVKSRGRQ